MTQVSKARQMAFFVKYRNVSTERFLKVRL